ncbi:MAG: S1 RNA-binding domain-containing protein [Candidatus Kapaibacteriota bacterium]|jgi:small subunit ribosomal protein S1
MSLETENMTTNNTTDNPIVENTPVAEVTETPVVEVATEAAAVAEATTAPVSNEEYQEAVLSKAIEVKDEQATTIEENNNHKEILEKLTNFKNENSAFEIVITERTRGGFRASYEGFNLFLPISQYSSIKNLPDTELDAAIGSKISVKVIELPTEERISKSVVVSRTAIVEDELWNKFKVGDKVNGTVSSVPTFGVFLDLGGVEGLVHISKLSNNHIKETKSFAKVGDKLEAVIIELDRAKNKIALSMKELEANPWADIEEKYTIGSKVKGTVKKIVDFGAYVELESGIDALLRVSELSWTKRVRKIGDVVKVGDEIETAVVAVNTAKRNIALSLKQLSANPWLTYADRFSKEGEFDGTVLEVNDKGCVVTVENEVDAFMPKGRMRGVLVDNAIPYAVGDAIKVKVIDLLTEEESMILAPVLNEEQAANMAAERESRNAERGDNRGDRNDNRNSGDRRNNDDRPRRPREDRNSTPIDKSIAAGGGMSFADLLSNAALDKLKK